MDCSNACTTFNPLPVRIFVGESNIFQDRAGKKKAILRNIGYPFPETSKWVVQNITIINKDRSLWRIRETKQQIGQSRFATSHSADNPKSFAWLDAEGYVVQNLSVAARVTKRKSFDPKGTLKRNVHKRPFPVEDVGYYSKQFVNSVQRCN